MLNPKEQAKNGFRAAADRQADRQAARPASRAPIARDPVDDDAAGTSKDAIPLSLASLYQRFDALAMGRLPDEEGSDLQRAVLARLAATRRQAEAAGWSSFALERDPDTGRIRLVGIAEGAEQRTVVPDWTQQVEADARARRGDRPAHADKRTP